MTTEPQLHKILAENTWVFGEEYNLWVSDKDLRRVLEKHRDHLDPDISIDEPVKVIGKARGIIDLMFSRSTRRHRANDIEHVIVELKAPKVKIGADEITQAKKYAIAVTSDERLSRKSDFIKGGKQSARYYFTARDKGLERAVVPNFADI